MTGPDAPSNTPPLTTIMAGLRPRVTLVYVRALFLALILASPAAAAPAVGVEAPDFTLTDEAGAEHTLSALRGAPVVVNFWASWCGPCLHELPRLEELRQQTDVPVVLVNLDTQRGPAKGAIGRVEHSMLSLFDPKGAVAKAWEPPAMPTTYLIDPDGTVREVLTGAIEEDDVAELAQRVGALKRVGALEKEEAPQP